MKPRVDTFIQRAPGHGATHLCFSPPPPTTCLSQTPSEVYVLVFHVVSWHVNPGVTLLGVGLRACHMGGGYLSTLPSKNQLKKCGDRETPIYPVLSECSALLFSRPHPCSPTLRFKQLFFINSNRSDLYIRT